MVIDGVIHGFPDEGKQLKALGIDVMAAHIFHHLGENFREAEFMNVEFGNVFCRLGGFLQFQKLACIIFDPAFLPFGQPAREGKRQRVENNHEREHQSQELGLFLKEGGFLAVILAECAFMYRQQGALFDFWLANKCRKWRA